MSSATETTAASPSAQPFATLQKNIATFFTPQSLRQRLILWYTGLLLFVFILLSVVTYLVQRSVLIGDIQVSIDRETAIIKRSLDTQVSTNPPYWPAGTLQITAVDAYIEQGVTTTIIDTNDNIHYTSISMVPTTVLRAMAGKIATNDSTTVTLTLNHERLRVAAVPYFVNGTKIGTILITVSLAETEASLTTLGWLLFSATLPLLVLGIGGGWLLTRQALAPIDRIAQTATTITNAIRHDEASASQTLQQRIPDPVDSEELQSLVHDLNRMLDAIADHDNRQRQFIADASHELRTPLTSIRGNLEFIRRTPDLSTAEREEAMQQAAMEADRMALLVNDLLSLTRLEGARTEPRTYEQVEIDVQVISAYQFALERARFAKADAPTFVLDQIIPVRVWGDPQQLRQVLLILIDNAFKYAPGSTVTVSMQVQGQRVGLTVHDNGPGIAAQDLPYVFDRFYRANRERNREGSGLGLAIARSIIERHGGTISVSSGEEMGTTFTILLPLYQSTRA